MKNSLFIFTPCLPHDFHPVPWDQTTVIVCQSLGSRPTQVQELFTLVPCLFGTTSRCLSVQPVQLLPSRIIWRHISLIWPFPIDTGMPDVLLMLWNCFPDFAVEHWFGCRATEPGFAGDIGAIEVWLIDLFILVFDTGEFSNSNFSHKFLTRLIESVDNPLSICTF